MENYKSNEHWKVLVFLLDEIRKEKQITQLQVAAASGMHQSHVARFFQAKYCPGMDVFLEIAKAIGINFFFEDKENKSDLNRAMENAMERLGRRPDALDKN